MKEKSICFLCARLEYGGAQTQIVDLALILQQRGWDVTVISMRIPVALADRLNDSNIKVESLGMAKGVPNPVGLLKLVKLLNLIKPRVLHCHMFHANILGRMARIFASIPVLISTAHNVYEGAKWREVAYRITDRLTDITTNVSQAAVERYVRIRAVPHNRIRLMYNGLDVKRFNTNPDDGEKVRKELNLPGLFVWLAIGRLSAQKDYPNLLHAFKKSMKDDVESILLIVGVGEIREALEALADQLAISHLVYFPGARKDVENVMNAADAYVMSSAWEGFPMVLLEAAATELPIVCTDVGGNREIVEDGYNGLLVEAKNSESLSGGMRKMMDLPATKRKEMGKNGRRKVVKNFSLEKLADSWESLYSELDETAQVMG